MEIGDRIKFRVCLRSGFKTATRKVNGFWVEKIGGKRTPTVRFNGFESFIVKPSEVLEVIKTPEV